MLMSSMEIKIPFFIIPGLILAIEDTSNAM